MEQSLAVMQDRKDFRIVHYSFQSNHAHFVVEAAGREALARGMKALGARVARAANRVFDRTGPVLEDRYHLRVVRTPREVRSCISYVLNNARRHARERAHGTARLDPASSARWFDGWKRAGKRRGEEVARAERRCVAPARTWLLSTGWRRHGLIDLSEVPGPAG